MEDRTLNEKETTERKNSSFPLRRRGWKKRIGPLRKGRRPIREKGVRVEKKKGGDGWGATQTLK